MRTHFNTSLSLKTPPKSFSILVSLALAATGAVVAENAPKIWKSSTFLDSDHNVSNFIYWGSRDGFSESRRTEVPNPGPHLLSGRDIGNVYDRSDRYDYIPPPFDTGAVSRFESLRWEGEVPFRTRLEFQVRTGATREELAAAAWSGPSGAGSFYTKSGETLKGPGATGRWIQYKATLVSPDDANTPVLRAVSISYR